MSRLRLNQSATPSAPATGKSDDYLDSADARRKVKHADGRTEVLSPSNFLGNYLHNGGFMFAQRQAPGTLTTYNSTLRTYAADRWAAVNENASLQYQRVDTSSSPETGLAARFYGRYKKITNAGKFIVSQVIEGVDAQTLRGRNVRFQARLRCSVASSMTVRMALLQLTSAGTVDTVPASIASAFGAAATDPTWGTNLSAITPNLTESTGTISGAGITCATTTSWQRFSATFTVPSSCKNLVVVIFTHNQPAANDELNIAEAGLYDGEQIMDWSPRPLQQELALCQRYYCKTFNVDTAPATNIGVNTGEFRFQAGKAAATAELSPTVFFPVPMRQAPGTVTLYNPAAANAQVRDITGAVDCSASAVAGATERGAYVSATGNAATAVGNHLGIHLTFDGADL